MTVREALGEGARILENGTSGSPFLDASLLLSLASGLCRDALLSDHLRELDDDAVTAYRALLERRAAGEPVAYILGRKEFRGLDFFVTPDVLVPRPDTELLVETALAEIDRIAAARTGSVRLHDACTGSGCVGIALARERPACEVSLSDISDAAIAVASRNAFALLGHAVPIVKSDLLQAVHGPFDVVTANPPYVERGLIADLAKDGVRDPFLALDGGPDGRMLYGRLAREAAGRIAVGGALVLEIGEGQGSAVSAELAAAGFADIAVLKDLAGHDRVVRGRMP